MFQLFSPIVQECKVFSLLCVLAEGKLQVVEGRGKQVEMRVQRRVRMGKKDEVGSPYILSPSQVT